MTDNDNFSRFALIVVLVGLLVGVVAYHCFVRYYRTGTEQAVSETNIAVTKQAAVSSQASVDSRISQYTAQKVQNVQHEKTAAKNAVAACDMKSDGEIIAEFADLLQRAREFNARNRESAGKEGESGE